MDKKTCNTCHQTLDLDAFNRNNHCARDGHQNYCRECGKDKMSKYWKENQDKIRNRTYLRRYGLSLLEIVAIWEGQARSCRICKEPIGEPGQGHKETNLDHCHTSGNLRAILCGACNRGLGHFRDSPSYLRNAADYLESF